MNKGKEPGVVVVRVLAAGVIVVLLGSVGPAARGAPVVAGASQPARPTTGPGSAGRCGMAAATVTNPLAPDLPVHVFGPTGRAPATVAGGRCDAGERPTWFLAHGLNGSDPSAYVELIRHLVSVGNVVVYPTYAVGDGEKATLEHAYRVVDAGAVAAAAATGRIDTTRVGWWGHSMGGSMVPYLAAQVRARGWGSRASWMTNQAQTFALLVGGGAIPVPPRTQLLTVGFEHDGFADNRIGAEVFDAVALPRAQKRHVTVSTDPHGQPAFVADHSAPSATEGRADAVDFHLWRLADLLETCALTGEGCDADWSDAGTWSDGTPVVPSTVTWRPVDSGPYPAVLAECDGVYGQQLNRDRLHRCGPTHV